MLPHLVLSRTHAAKLGRFEQLSFGGTYDENVVQDFWKKSNQKERLQADIPPHVFCAGGASGSAADLIEKAKKAVHELQNGPMRKVDELMWGKPEDVTTDVAKSVLKEAAKSLGNVMLIAKEIKALARVKTD